MNLAKTHTFTRRQKIWLFLALVMIGVSFSLAAADKCYWCERHAILAKGDNIHFPEDYFKKLQEWLDCMDKLLPYDIFSEDDPLLLSARAECKHLEPDKPPEVMYSGSIEGFIAWLCTSDCFHMRYRRHKISYTLPTEYVFEMTFNAGLGGKETFIERGSEKEIESTLTISLYYDGDERIHVKTWQTHSPINSASSHYNRMFRNKDAQMRQDLPLEGIMWEFESTPTECQIKPRKKVVKAGQTMEVKVSGFLGQKGPSRGFNRIVVKADRGEILNGAECSSDPRARVFKVGQ